MTEKETEDTLVEITETLVEVNKAIALHEEKLDALLEAIEMQTLALNAIYG